MQKYAFVTGATGFVTPSVVSELRKKGYGIVFLTRPNKRQSAIERLRNVIGEISQNDYVLDGDITLPSGGVRENELRPWIGKIEVFVHGAASTSFNPLLSEEICATNLQGTGNMLNLAAFLKIPHFCYIGTAYIAGDSAVFNENDFAIGQNFHNSYESSKFQAEALVRNWSEGNYSIFRSGIVVGDTNTGVASSFDGYYGCFKIFWLLRETLKKRFEQNREKSIKQGIKFDDNGILHLPLNIPCSGNSTLNLIPRDWLARTIAGLIATPSSNNIFHLVHPKPPEVRFVSESSLKLLGISGLSYNNPTDLSSWPLLTRLQRALQDGLKEYIPYINHGPSFGSKNLVRVLGNRYVPPPKITEDFLYNIIRYAKSVNFGRGKK